MFLSLGADIHFFVDSWSEEAKSKRGSRKWKNAGGYEGDEDNGVDSGEDDYGDGDDGERSTKKTSGNVMKITMTHGNLLIIKNCRIDVSDEQRVCSPLPH